jgi:hypothetical protein
MIVKVKIVADGVTYDQCREALVTKVKPWKDQQFKLTSDLNVVQKRYYGNLRFVGTCTFSKMEPDL